MNTKKISVIFALVIGLSSAALFAHGADAAGISFSTPSSTIHQGQVVAVDVMLDPAGQDVNTVAAAVVIPDDVDFVSADDSASVIGLWVDGPTFSPLTRTLTFSGIIPGGFSGSIDPYDPSSYKPGTLIRIYVSGRAPGTGTFSLTDAEAYLNDGLGTQTSVSSGTLALTVDQLLEEGGVGASTDSTPPLPFTPLIERDPNLDGGKYVVIFNTEDKGSGIDHYEVREGNGPWVVAQSPYVLKDQSVSGDVTVKAVDHAGNAQYETVPGLRSTEFLQSLALGVLIALIVLFFLLALRRRKKRDAFRHAGQK